MLKNISVFLHRNFLAQKKKKFSFFALIAENLALLLGLGYGVGFYVGGIQNSNYINFLFPGFLMYHAAMVAFLETYFLNNKVEILTLIGPTQKSSTHFFMAEIMWAVIKALVSVVIFYVISLIFVSGSLAFFIDGLALSIFVSLYFAILGLIFSYFYSLREAGFSFLFIPMVLVSGIYFPQEQLPLPIKLFSYLTPLGESANILKSVMGIASGSFYSIFAVILVTGLLLSFFIYKLAQTKK